MDTPSADVACVQAVLQDWQQQLIEWLTHTCQSQLVNDQWSYQSGRGGGQAHAIAHSAIFESGGVNFSHIRGTSLPPSATTTRPQVAGHPFEACGVSVILHPHNPFVPASHANLRLMMTHPPDHPPIWWFGGGFDLTPTYGFERDACDWHHAAYTACTVLSPNPYEDYKKAADDYFYLPHRREGRGIGGLFFDDLNQFDFVTCLEFIQSVARQYTSAYQTLVNRRQDTPYQTAHKDFQCLRRGRYVEFNLLYDRGTLFGLQSGGRTESILLSLPKTVHWQYNFMPTPGSDEARLIDYFLQPQDWRNHRASTSKKST